MAATLSVLHLVDAADDGQRMWGKETMILSLLRQQADTQDLAPALATFSPATLAKAAERDHIQTTVLYPRHRISAGVLDAGVRRLLAARSPDILHTHGYKANLVGRLARRFAAPSTHLVSTCHGFVDSSSKLRLYHSLDRATSGWSDAVVVASTSMLPRFRTAGHIVLIANGTSIPARPSEAERDALRRRWGFASADWVVGMLGRFEKAKGIKEMAQAARRTRGRGIRWVAAGGNEFSSALGGQVPENLEALGFVAPHELLPALDAYVQPSRSEGLSMALLEAAAAGLPIVATRVGETEKVLRHEREALLIEPRNAGALAEAVQRLHRRKALAGRLAAAARRRVESRFSTQAMARDHRALYHQLINDGRKE